MEFADQNLLTIRLGPSIINIDVKVSLYTLMGQVLPASVNRHKPDKMMMELREKLEMRDLGQEEVDTSVRGSSLSRGLDGRIVMEIKKDQEFGQKDQRPRKRRSLVESVIGSLGRKRNGERKEFSDSATRYAVFNFADKKLY